MKQYQYIGNPNPRFDPSIWYTVEIAYNGFDALKFYESTDRIGLSFLLNNFKEVTENDRYHKKLLNAIED